MILMILATTKYRYAPRFQGDGFHRRSMPVEVTSDGQNIIAYFQMIMSMHRKLEVYCGNVRKQHEADLMIGAPSFFCTCLLPSVISDFRGECPDYHVKIIECNDIDLRKFLRGGIADMGLSVEDDIPSGMKAITLKEESIILAVPGSYDINRSIGQYALTREEIISGSIPQEKIRKLPMNLFSNERFLLLKPGNDMYCKSREICRDSGFEPLEIMELDQLLTAYHLAVAGEGIAFISSSIPRYVEDQGRLRFYYIDHVAATRRIRLICNSEADLNAKQNCFIGCLKKSLLPD